MKPAATPPHPTLALSGWLRQCSVCGAIDVHAVYPSAVMADRSAWHCETCGSARHEAIHVPLDATTCPAMQPAGAR
ncbi:MAG: hypothetical protein AAGC53_03425 [Actinomycetota bacterium]